MCVSKETSLKVFLIGLLSSIVLYKNGEIYQSICIFTISLLQLAEYFMWKDIKGESHVYKLGNLLGLLGLLLQTVGFRIIIGKLDYIQYANILFFGYVIFKYIKAGYPKTTETSNGHLRWGFWEVLTKRETIYGLLLYLIGLCSSGSTDGYRHPVYAVFIWAFLLLISINITGSNIYSVDKWGSMWCYTSNMVGPILALQSLKI